MDTYRECINCIKGHYILYLSYVYYLHAVYSQFKHSQCYSLCQYILLIHTLLNTVCVNTLLIHKLLSQYYTINTHMTL